MSKMPNIQVVDKTSENFTKLWLEEEIHRMYAREYNFSNSSGLRRKNMYTILYRLINGLLLVRET